MTEPRSSLWFARTFKPISDTSQETIQPCRHDATRFEIAKNEHRLVCVACGKVVLRRWRS